MSPNPTSPVRRKARLAALVACCVMGGSAVTLVVAAACLLYSPMRMVEDHGGVSSDEIGDRQPGSVAFKHGQLYSGFGYREWENYWTWVPNGPTAAAHGSIGGAGVAAFRCGWPFLAFETSPDRFPEVCERAEWDAAVRAAYSRPTTSDLLSPSLRARPYRGIPAQPIWLGLFGNILVYSLLLAGCWLAIRAARRTRRRRTGRCTACGYPVRGLQKCPECGLGLAQRLTLRLRHALAQPLCHFATLPLLPFSRSLRLFVSPPGGPP